MVYVIENSTGYCDGMECRKEDGNMEIIKFKNERGDKKTNTCEEYTNIHSQ